MAIATPADASSAAAPSSRQPVVILETINNTTGATTFVASSPLCRRGAFVDTVVADRQQGSIVHLKIDTVYTCTNGAGTFLAVKHLRLVILGDHMIDSTGRIRFTGGTGAFTGMTGSGSDTGGIVVNHGSGVIRARIHLAA